MTKRAQLLILAAVACLPLACKDGGCGGGGNGGAPSAATAALSAAGSTPVAAASSGPRNRALMVRAGGAVGALFRAASQLDLKDDQRTKIEKIAADMRESDKATQESDAGGARKDMKAIHDEIVAGVKGGKIDTAKISLLLANLEKDAKDRQARDLEALGKLHAVLEPEQRTKIAQGVKKTDDERASRMKTDAGAESGHGGDGGKPSMTYRRYERYGKELGLDADQQTKLSAIIPKDDPNAPTEMRDDMKKRSDATLAAFEKETFDSKSLAPPDSKRIRQPIEDQVKFYNQLLPILKPEQREKLAGKVEKQGGSAGMEHGRRRGPGSGDPDHDTDHDDREDRDVH